ncbi:hypothetical protein DPEC_G00288790 [Dallia pectoralis]|uniref:Uncharacterized protein n=1 Tax=Dallia pectoralis TaxID=75939 RepID=A0ACC2FKL8_DALPE|nr:hypothetical protein DPEC_G00288790 [Dallia pectoralis]
MSRRSSAGDLVPRDISEILAREVKTQRAQKKAGGSLGQAFSWLKGSKRKKSGCSEQNRTGSVIGVAESHGTKHQIQDSPKAGPKAQDEQRRLTVHYSTSSQYQENVFVEGSRPQFIQDLHTEAQQGLKIQQQEEHGNGVDVQDDHINVGLQPEQDVGSQDQDGPQESRNSSSSVSLRPMLTAQGSTFKPLNPVKRQENGKKRIRRTTIMGLPQQIHRELALHRGSDFEVTSSHSNNLEGPISDGQPDTVVIPTIDGENLTTNQNGARVHLSHLEASREKQLLKRHLQNVYREDQCFSHHHSHLSPTQRPKSLAVPGMTSSAGIHNFLQEPQGPVMCISPQATYLSKIIPNAYLPASVEVIQISRGTGRCRGNNGNHGASKGSIASGSSASPALSRKSGGDNCCDDGDGVSHGGSSFQDDGSTATPHSGTSGSGWGHSQSSETIKSNSSSISSTKGSFGPANPQTACLTGQETGPQQPGPGDNELVSLKNGWDSSISTGQERSESGLSGDTSDAEGDSHKLSRNLSITKTRTPPAPPRRTNSLHHEEMMKRRPQELVGIRDLRHSVGREVKAGEDTDLVTNGVSKELYKQNTKSSELGSKSSDVTRCSRNSSPLSPTMASLEDSETPETPKSNSTSPQKAPSEGGKFDRTLSPSSGYSSQSGTPTLSPRGIYPSVSTGKQNKPGKPERSGSRASTSSSTTSLSSVTSEHVNPSPLQQDSPPPASMTTKMLGNQAHSPVSVEIRKLLNIPAPPNVKAPSPPPPETWAQNRRTIELLCPSSFHNINSLALTQKQQELIETTLPERQEEPQNKDSKEFQGLTAEQATIREVVLTTTESRDNYSKKIKPTLEQASGKHASECLTKDRESPLFPKSKGASVDEQKQSSDANNQDQEVKHQTQDQVSSAMNRKKKPPPVMKKSTITPRPKVQIASVNQHQVPTDNVTIEVDLTTKNEMFVLQSEVEVFKEVSGLAKEVQVVTKQVDVGSVANEGVVEAKQVDIEDVAFGVVVVTKQGEDEVVAKEAKVVNKQVENEVIAKEAKVVNKQVENEVIAKEAKVVTKQVEDEVIAKEAKVVNKQVENEVIAKEAKVVNKQVENEVIAKEAKVVTKQVEDEVIAKEAKVVTKQVEDEDVAEEVEGQSAIAIEKCPTKQAPSRKTIGSMELPKVSPPASPPPAHHPPPPPSNTPPTSVSILLPEIEQGVEEEVLVVESNWPPPPPPEEPADSEFDDPDEMAFPPPPPPFITDSQGGDMLLTSNTTVDVQKTSIVAPLGVCADGETLNRATVAEKTVNVEAASLSPILTQIYIKEERPEKAVLYSNPNAVSADRMPSYDLTGVHSNEEEPEFNQLSSKPTNMQEVTPESQVITAPLHKTPPPLITTALGPLSSAPPLITTALGPLSSAPPPPLITTALGPLSGAPPPPHVILPLPTAVQFENLTPSEPPTSATSVIVPLPAENLPPVTFRRQPSFQNREAKARSKELLSRHKSAPIPKEDANIPLVTPSLLQMVRLRSVNVSEDQIETPSGDDNNNDNVNENTPALYESSNPVQTLGSHNSTPQKPVRKSLSLKPTASSSNSTPATLVAPSMRLQEAIRMKTAAMSSRDGLPTRFRMPSSTTFPSSSGESGMLSRISLEGADSLKSPASTASFVFSKSSKKVVIETPVSSSVVQVSLHQSLAEELKLVSDQSKASTVTNGNVGKAGIVKRVPPPVAKKPTHAFTNASERLVCSTVKSGIIPSPRRPEANQGIETVQPAGQQALPEDQNTGGTMETCYIPGAPLPL